MEGELVARNCRHAYNHLVRYGRETTDVGHGGCTCQLASGVRAADDSLDLGCVAIYGDIVGHAVLRKAEVDSSPYRTFVAFGLRDSGNWKRTFEDQ